MSYLESPLNTEMLFGQGFWGEEEEFGFVYEEPPLANLLMSLVAPTASPSATPAATPTATVPRDEAGPSSGRSMKQIMIKVPEGVNILKKSNRSAVWLKPLIGPY